MYNNQIILVLLSLFLPLLPPCGGLSSFASVPVRCRTTKGSIVIKVYPEWAPIGAERFLDLVKDGFYTDIAMYRCVSKFLTQFGISDNKDLKHWHNENIKDDIDKKLGIKKHYVSFAGGGKNSRSTQIFIAFEDLEWLGVQSDGIYNPFFDAENATIYYVMHYIFRKSELGDPVWRGGRRLRGTKRSIQGIWRYRSIQQERTRPAEDTQPRKFIY